MTEQTTFGAWLRQRRKEQGINADEIADRIGCSAITLHKIEAGERRPSRQIAELLASAFDIPADEQEVFIAFARAGDHPKSAISTEPTFDEAASRAPWRSARAHQTNLPAPLTPLIGRAAEEAEARELLLHSKARLLTLVGPPGIGKTRLALQLASELVGRFEDGVYFVDLAPILDPDLVLSTIARALPLDDMANRPIEDVLLGYVRGKRLLLFLDNFEQVLDAASDVVRLLHAGPWLKALITSREALHVRGERRFYVPPLEVPGIDYRVPNSSNPPGLWLAVLGTIPSVQLFIERAQEVAPDFALTDETAEDVAQVCVALEGLPLAIELAGARAGYLTPGEMRAALNNRLKVLTEGPRDLPARQRTLRNAIAWSYDLLGDEEQALFRRLGVFVGGFTAEAARVVCNRDRASPFEAVLASLADKSLIREQRRGEAGSLRFRMLEALHEYAWERLQESGEGREIEREHALYFMRLAEEAESHLTGTEQAEWLDQLEKEHDNLRAAIQWAKDNSSKDGIGAEDSLSAEVAEIGLRLVGALSRFWYIRGYYGEGREYLAGALESSLSPALIRSPFRAKTLTAAGMLVTLQGDYASGRALHEESLAIRRGIGDKKGVGISLNHLGTMAHEQGDYPRARALFEESLAIRREIGDKVGEALVLTNLASAVQQQEDYTTARSLLEDSLAIKREIGHKESLANSLNNLGTLLCEEGDYAKARSVYEESFAIRREVGSKRGMASSLSNLADLAYRQGDYTTARTLFVESLSIKYEIRDNISLPWALVGLGGVAVAIGDVQRGVRLLGAASMLWEGMGVAPEVSTRQVYERSIASAQAQLGQDLFEQAWTEGRSLTLEEAVEYALGQGTSK